MLGKFKYLFSENRKHFLNELDDLTCNEIYEIVDFILKIPFLKKDKEFFIKLAEKLSNKECFKAEIFDKLADFTWNKVKEIFLVNYLKFEEFSKRHKNLLKIANQYIENLLKKKTFNQIDKLEKEFCIFYLKKINDPYIFKLEFLEQLFLERKEDKELALIIFNRLMKVDKEKYLKYIKSHLKYINFSEENIEEKYQNFYNKILNAWLKNNKINLKKLKLPIFLKHLLFPIADHYLRAELLKDFYEDQLKNINISKVSKFLIIEELEMEYNKPFFLMPQIILNDYYFDVSLNVPNKLFDIDIGNLFFLEHGELKEKLALLLKVFTLIKDGLFRNFYEGRYSRVLKDSDSSDLANYLKFLSALKLKLYSQALDILYRDLTFFNADYFNFLRMYIRFYMFLHTKDYLYLSTAKEMFEAYLSDCKHNNLKFWKILFFDFDDATDVYLNSIIEDISTMNENFWKYYLLIKLNFKLRILDNRELISEILKFINKDNGFILFKLIKDIELLNYLVIKLTFKQIILLQDEIADLIKKLNQETKEKIFETVYLNIEKFKNHNIKKIKENLPQHYKKFL